MNNKILCVDDEPNILQAYKRNLRKDFDIYLAESGAEALAMMESDGPFAVISSDMRMPGMDGIQFLSRAKEAAPDSVRIMLTGNSDQHTAMEAVNEGNIFRFLTKPCSPEALEKALNAGIEQYRLITAEKDLLENTLNKSLQVLVDTLAIVNPTAFSRSARVKRIAANIASRLKIEKVWEVEIAAMLSQIGCVSVPEEVLQKIATGDPISEKEIALYHAHPQMGHDLVVQIPRMATVAEIIAKQNRRINDEPAPETPSGEASDATMGARILKLVLDYDRLTGSGNLPREAHTELLGRAGWYDQRVLDALQNTIKFGVEDFVTRELNVYALRPGMVLAGDLVSTRGALLLSAGQEVSIPLKLRLVNLAEAGMIADHLVMNVPVSIGGSHAVLSAN